MQALRPSPGTADQVTGTPSRTNVLPMLTRFAIGAEAAAIEGVDELARKQMHAIGELLFRRRKQVLRGQAVAWKSVEELPLHAPRSYPAGHQRPSVVDVGRAGPGCFPSASRVTIEVQTTF